MTDLLSEALAGLACYGTDLARPFDRIFERCALTPEDVRIEGRTRSHIWEKSLMPLPLTGPRPASPFTGFGASRQARSWFYVGELSHATANLDFKQQVCNANAEKSPVCQPRALTPGLKVGAPRAIRS